MLLMAAAMNGVAADLFNQQYFFPNLFTKAREMGAVTYIWNQIMTSMKILLPVPIHKSGHFLVDSV